MTKNFILILILSTFIGCTTNKYTADYMANNEIINNLCVYKPYVNVVGLTKGQSTYSSVLSKNIKSKIAEETINILENKYVLEVSNNELDRDSLTRIAIRELLQHLDSSDQILGDIKTPPLLDSLSKNSKSRYGMIAFLFGYYDVNYNRYDNYRGYNSPFVTPGVTIYFPLKDHFGINMRIIIFDKLKGRIIFYNDLMANSGDPRIPSNVDRIIINSLRPIYYR